MGTAAAGLDIPRGLYLGVSFAVFRGLTLVCYHFLVPGAEPEEPETAPAPTATGSWTGSGSAPWRRPVALWPSGPLAAVGMSSTLLVSSVPLTILGLGLAGLGVATLVPVVMHSADELPGLRTGTGLTVISWLLRLGLLLSPPIAGTVADSSSLRAGLVIVQLAGVLALLASLVLPKRVRNRNRASGVGDGSTHQ